MLYQKILRPLLFKLDPENAHELATRSLQLLNHSKVGLNLLKRFTENNGSAVDVFGLQSQLVDEAFFTFEISEEVSGQKVRLIRVRDSLLKAEDLLFALPDVLDEEKGPYADFLNHVTKVRVAMLNDLIDFSEPYTIEEMEEVLSEKQNNDFLEGRRSHFSDELVAILEFVPDGFEIDSDLVDESAGEDEGEEDYSDLDTHLVEVSDKNEKLLPDEDLKCEEDEDREEEATPYEGGAPDEQQ